MPKGEEMYTSKIYTGTASTKEYLEYYVDTEKFIKYCKECPNYGKIWSCPEYDFKPEELWRKYEWLQVYACVITPDYESMKELSHEEKSSEIMKILHEERQKLDKMISEAEQAEEGSLGLYAGSCVICGKENCSRIEGKSCKHPEKMHYSIESLGGDITATLEDIVGVEIKWEKDGNFPEYYTLTCGLLTK